jgi:hypothetical protein
MSSQPILPEHEVVVSSVVCTESSIVFRVVEDYHPEAKPNACEISIIGPRGHAATPLSSRFSISANIRATASTLVSETAVFPFKRMDRPGSGHADLKRRRC